MEVKLPNYDVNDTEAIISDIYVIEGSYINKGDKIFKIETAKTVREMIAEESGYINICCQRMDRKKIGETIAYISMNYADIETKEKRESTKEAMAINATNKAIELADKLGVNLEEVAAVKKEGIIKGEDVQKFADENRIEKTIEFPVFRQRINQYDRERVVIIGAGKGAEMVIDILLDDKDKTIVGLVDSYEKEFLSYSYPMLPGTVDEFPDTVDRGVYDTVILTMGSTRDTMKARKKIFENYQSKEIAFTNAIADSVDIRRAVNIGSGNIIMHHSYIGTGTDIGDNNVISYGMKLGHHSTMGSHNLIAPGFTTAGCVNIGSECVIMTGVVTRNCVNIGNKVILPLGYTVDWDLKDKTVIRSKNG